MTTKFKPGVPKRYLLLVAGIVWTIAGTILLTKGASYVLQFSNFKILRFIIAFLFGIGFYWVLFTRISLKHINRIKSIDIVKPCIFSFFNFKSYLLVALMISMGIVLRKTEWINHDLLFTFYMGMAIPLLLSAARFYYAWFKYNRAVNYGSEKYL
jgi:hypothetical protein